jgi:hypothetical protein
MYSAAVEMGDAMSKNFNVCLCFFVIIINAALAGGACISPGSTPTATRTALQKTLDAGNDCILCQKQIYEIDTALVYKAPNQKIYTDSANFISQYATIRTANRKVLIAIDGQLQDSVVLEKVIVDGNRYRIGADTMVSAEKALLLFGVKSGHKIRRNVIMSTRSWSTLQIHEGTGTSVNNIAENNLILGAGPDGRGNGVSTNENQTRKGHWADCMSLGARTTVVRNNFLLEPTDLGVAIFSALGSTIENNVQASWSREALGSFDMVDGIAVYKDSNTTYDGKPTYPYTGTVIRNNFSDAYGSRINIGFALGQPIWQGSYQMVMRNGTVTGNSMSGEAYGYGIAARGLLNFTVTGNVSTATHSGKGNGTGGVAPPDPAAFQYYKASTFTSTLQPEFVDVNTTAFINLLRVNAPPYIDGGTANNIFICTPYTNVEAAAIVKAAYVEMLHRFPTSTELTDKQTWLQTLTTDGAGRQRNLNTADMLRLQLDQTDEFMTKFGAIAATKDAMELFRINQWQQALATRIDDYMTKTGAYPPIDSIYVSVRDAWEGKGVTGTVPTGAKAGMERRFTFSLAGGKILYSGPGDNMQRVVIYSLQGDILKEFPLDAASRLVIWDGKDRFGRQIANGVYPVQISGLIKKLRFSVIVAR